MSKLRAGFFCDDGVPFNEDLASLWAQHTDVSGMPFCFRIHLWKRDYPESIRALAWCRAHGMRPFLSVMEASVGQLPLITEWSWSFYNDHDWRNAPLSGIHVQDDSGPVGAMNILRHRGLVAKPLLFHAYGQSGMRTKNLPILREEAAKRGVELIWSECGWGFPGKDKTIGDRPDVTEAGSGAWTRDAVIEAATLGIPCAVYKPKYFFCDDGKPNAAGAALFGYSDAKPHNPPRFKAWKMTWSMKGA